MIYCEELEKQAKRMTFTSKLNISTVLIGQTVNIKIAEFEE